MSLITLTYVFSTGATIIASQHNTNNSTIYNDYNGNIIDTNVASNAAIAYTKLALNNTIRSSDILTSTIFAIGNIPTLSYSNITQFPYVKCSNTQNSGTNGGSATTGSWQTMPLNTKDNDTGSIATLTSNQISLPSGTYLVNASSPFHETALSQIRVYNVTGSAILVNGQCAEAPSSLSAAMYTGLNGLFTLSTTSTVALQYQCGTNSGTSDLGLACSFGTEVYAVIELTKVA